MEFEHRWKDVKKLRVFTLKKKSNKTEGRLFFLSKNEEILVLEAQFIIPYKKKPITIINFEYQKYKKHFHDDRYCRPKCDDANSPLQHRAAPQRTQSLDA